jgi:hypothetical protein
MTAVLINKPVFFIYCLQRTNGLRPLADDRAFAHLQKRFFSALNDETRFLYFLYLSYDAAIGDDLIIYLQIIDQVLKLLFLLLLRQYDKEIKDAEDEDKGQKRPNYTSAARFLEKQ